MAKKRLFDEDGNEVKGKIKKPFYKKVWFWALIVIIVLFAWPTSPEDGTTDVTKVDSGDSTQEAEAEEKEDLEEEVFNVGDTVSYKGYDIKVNSVDYSDGGEYDDLDEGYQFVIVNITITNNTEEKQSYNPYDYMLNADGNATSLDAFMYDSKDELSSGELDPGATVTANLYGEAKADASSLKLQYEASFWDDITVDINLK